MGTPEKDRRTESLHVRLPRGLKRRLRAVAGKMSIAEWIELTVEQDEERLHIPYARTEDT